MNKIMKKYIILLITTLLISNCASIVSKSSYNVGIQSSSEKANFVVKNEQGLPIQRGQTPAVVNLNASNGYFSGASYTVEYTKNGKKIISMINPTLDPWYIGNIVFGGLIGFLIVDPITGAMWKLPNMTYGNF